MKLFLSALCLLGALNVLSAQPSKFPPINDISKDKSLVTFVNQLKVAVKKQDMAFLLTSLDEKVMSDLGSEGGIDEFKEAWGLNKGDTSIWHHLSRVLELGGAFDQDAIKHGEERYTVVFPYVHLIELPDPDDYIHIGVITGKKVNLREKPDLNAKVLTQLTYDVVRFVEENQDLQKSAGTNAWNDPEWYQIETLDRKTSGWVNWKYVYSPISFRLYLFKNKQGKWKISTFVAGD